MRAWNLVTLAGTAALASASPAAARPLALDDLANLREVESPAIDPTGSWVAYSVGSIDTKADKSFSHIWMTSWDGTRSVQLTNRAKESESTPRWSPDGRFLAFVSSRDDKHDNDQLWLLDRTGGEARPLTRLDGSVVDYAWSPNSREIVLVVLDPDPDADPDDAAKSDDDKKPPKPIVIDRFQFKRDIDGYLRDRRQRLVMFDMATGKTRRLTDGAFDEYLPAWSPDGSRLAFVSNRDKDPDRSYNYDLWVVPASAKGEAPARLTTYPGYDNEPDTESYPAWSPDGRSIAYLQGGPVELFSYGVHQLALVPASGGTPRILTPGLDRNVGKPMWSADGRSLRFIVEDDKTQWLGSVGVAGGPIKRLAGGRAVINTIDQAKAKQVALITDPSHPPEVFAIEGTTLRPLSHQNAWLADVQLAPVDDTSFKSRDGTEVHGFLLRPVGGTTGRAPTILRLHGGPQSQFDYGFSFEWQLLAANGYAVVAANPRGGTGRGQDYAKALYADWGGVAVPDVLGAVDDAVARGIADPNRLGVGGWSYGGMLTNYVIASDPRFKAATSGASISNIFAGYGTDQYIRDYEIELGKPWEHLDVWMKNSYPFYHVDKIVTPTLFLAGDKDFNVPLLNSEQMYQALKSRGVDTELIIYPGQFHGIKRPSFVRDRYERYLAWYAKYLK
ncbi:S9 family peptidase [Sphingomonas sp.]|uniref:S9 family peptidase n=1 Tax=Sphingomonas sp. TaxID=28214 RepID=UPI00286CEAC7|nr:S9 family peptidase [Sphingomonas sp.]